MSADLNYSARSAALARRSSSRALARVSLFALLTTLGACSWFTDFKEQPKFEPWRTANDSTPPRGNPQNSVPVYGTLAPGYAVSRLALPGTVDSMSAIQNPVPADSRSLHNGRMYYSINCAVCHGDAGKGNQELGAPNLTDKIWLYGSDEATIVETVTNGRSGVMPAWVGRLDPSTIKALAVYVHSLGGGK